MAAKTSKKSASKVKTRKSSPKSVVKTADAPLDTKVVKSRKNPKLWLILGSIVLILVLLFAGKRYFISAMVNGKPISRFAQIKQMEKTFSQAGQLVGKESLDNLVTEEIISQEAKKEHIVVSDEDVQKEIETLTKSAESQGTTLDAALATRGMTKEDLEKNIKLQKTVEALLAPQLAISDEDVQKYFEDNKALYGEDAKFEDLKESVKNDFRQEKFSTEFQNWYQKLQSESDIKYFVSY